MNKQTLTKKVIAKLTSKPCIIRLEGRHINAGGVYRVIQIGNKKPYVCITTFRGSKTLEENKKNNENLLKTIKSLGYYAYSLIGLYKECPDNNPDCKEEDKKQVSEESFFVPYNEGANTVEDFIKVFGKIAKDFSQDSILVGLPKAYDYDGKDSLTFGDKQVPVGSHYYYNPSSNSFDSAGAHLKPAMIEGYGSRAIDPKKKDRTIDWKIVGTLQPSSVMGMHAYRSSGLQWVEGMNVDTAKWFDSVEDYLKAHKK